VRTLAKLTDKVVRSLTGPVDGKKPYQIHYDGREGVRGFGIRVTRAGAKSFVLNYRARGVERRLTLGSFPDWSVAQAREEAKRLKRLVDQGRDPMGERHEERRAPTVADLADRYLVEHAPKKRERSRHEDQSVITQWIRPALGNKKVADVRHADIERLHSRITAYGTRVRANRCVALLSKMFSLATRWEMRSSDNPCRGIERNAEEPRNRYLAGDELRRLVEALRVFPNQAAANAIKLLLLTGSRRSEVLSASWNQFNLEEGIWVKPSSHTKQKREHRIPISGAVRLLVGEMRAAADQRAAETDRPASPFLFPAPRGARQGPGHMVELKGPWRQLCKAAGIDGLRPHDLRHSYASFLINSGASLALIGSLLGHSNPSTTSRYSHLFDSPLRLAAEKVAAIVSGGNSDTAEVIEINRRGQNG
jgi:integrase